MRRWLVLSFLMLALWGTWLPTIAQKPIFTINEYSPQDQTFAPPPAGENSVLISAGQSLTLSCPAAPDGGGVMCAPQLALDVAGSSTGLTFTVRSDSEFVVFLRFDQEVAIEDGRAVSDFATTSTDGQLVLSIPTFHPGTEFPGLQPGRYFFAIAHFEPADVRFTVTGGATSPRSLTFGSPTTFQCTAFESLCLQQFTVRVDGSQRLNLDFLADGDFLAYVRVGEPVQLPELTFDAEGRGQIGNPITDASAPSNNGQARMVFDSTTSPPLQAGLYYVAVASVENFDIEVTVTASQGAQPQARPPIAEFSFSPENPRVGDEVTFSDDSNDDGEVVQWSWDFGDGNTSTDQHPVHSFTAPGTYRVSLLVTNDNQLSTVISKTLTVLSQPAITTTGIVALAFMQLAFPDPNAWERTVSQGCVTYANISSAAADVDLSSLDGEVRTFSISQGNTVLVCGNVAHFSS